MADDNGIHAAGDPRAPSARMPQSGLGIASFVIGLLAMVLIVAAAAAAGVLVAGGYNDATTPAFGLIGLVIMVFLLLALVGLVLGMLALRRQDRRRTLAAIGLGLNAFLLLGTLALYALGSLVSHSNS